MMFSRIRKRLTFANIVMTLALVFAMSGGAYAAGKYLITSTKQISPKVLKALKGKAGPAGTNGTNGVNAKDGAQGPVGAVGAVGPKGDTGGIGATGPAGPKGATGTTGPAGTNGTSVTSAAITANPANANCKEGGSEFTAASAKTFACNGANGAPGATGPTGPQGPLQTGATETGQWAAYMTAAAAFNYTSAVVSFTLPLQAALNEEHVHFMRAGVTNATGTGKLTSGSEIVTGVVTSSGTFTVNSPIFDTTTPANIPAGTRIRKVLSSGTELELTQEATSSAASDSLRAGNPAGCPTTGSVENPEAEPGNLCIYTKTENKMVLSNLLDQETGVSEAAGRTGTTMVLAATSTGTVENAGGTWAVTGK
jgi:hypothetical protein